MPSLSVWTVHCSLQSARPYVTVFLSQRKRHCSKRGKRQENKNYPSFAFLFLCFDKERQRERILSFSKERKRQKEIRLSLSAFSLFLTETKKESSLFLYQKIGKGRGHHAPCWDYYWTRNAFRSSVDKKCRSFLLFSFRVRHDGEDWIAKLSSGSNLPIKNYKYNKHEWRLVQAKVIMHSTPFAYCFIESATSWRPCLFDLLAVIKCSNCSYQCDSWYTFNWKCCSHKTF